jgi:hypothetical protein
VKIVVGPNDLLDPRRTERAYQLLFEIGDAHEEAEVLQVRTRELGAETGALERPAETPLLAGIAKTGEARAIRAAPKRWRNVPMRCAPPRRLDPNARGREVEAAPLGERFDRDLVALPFDDHD